MSVRNLTLKRAIRDGLSDYSSFSAQQRKIYRNTYFAYVWATAYEMTYRTTQLDATLFEGVGTNKFFKADFVANWLSQGSAPAPNNTALYTIAWLDLKGEDQVLSVPEIDYPNYYIMQLMDSAVNAVASIGPRTLPAYGEAQDFLIVGPDSQYYDQNIWSVDIDTEEGSKTLPLIRSGNNTTWVVMRQFVNSLDVESIKDVYEINTGSESEGGGFQLASLSTYQSEGSVPWEEPNSTLDYEEFNLLVYGSAPNRSAVRFFRQAGKGFRKNPLPSHVNYGEEETNVSIPSYTLWQGTRNPDQEEDRYPLDDWFEPSSMRAPNQKRVLKKLSSIGLTEKGFLPTFDTSDQDVASLAHAFRSAYRDALNWLQDYSQTAITGRRRTNYWGPNNVGLGAYDNDDQGFVTRAIAVIEGGSANVPVDATYPTANVDSDNKDLISTYNYSLTIPANSRIETVSEEEPSAQIIGPASGVSSFSIYQVNDGYAYSPNIIPNSINNLHYTPVDTVARFKRQRLDGEVFLTLEVDTPYLFNGDASLGMAFVFGRGGERYGLESNSIYYLKDYVYKDNERRIRFTFSDIYEFDYNPAGIEGTAGIPKPGSGTVGSVVVPDASHGDRVSLGFVNPVGTLGDFQLSVNNPETGELVETDSNYVFELDATKASIENPSNWLPSPYASTKEASGFQVMARYYYPNQSGDRIDHPRWYEGSVLPKQPTYSPPAVERESLARLNTWDVITGELVNQNRNDDVWAADSVAPFSRKDGYSKNIIGTFLDFSYLKPSAGELDIRFSVYSEADSANGRTPELQFVEVDSIFGGLGRGGRLAKLPGERGYKRLLRKNLVGEPIEITNTAVEHEVTLEAGKIYAPLIRQGRRQYLPFDDFNPSIITDRRFAFTGTDATSFLFEYSRIPSIDPNDGLFSLISVNVAS